jgi:hypothetical protein
MYSPDVIYTCMSLVLLFCVMLHVITYEDTVFVEPVQVCWVGTVVHTLALVTIASAFIKPNPRTWLTDKRKKYINVKEIIR